MDRTIKVKDGKVVSGMLSAARMVANAARAAGSALAAKVSRPSDPMMVPPEVAAERAARCGPCEHNSGGRCKLCGCYVGNQVLSKVQVATQACPDDPPRWSAWKP